MLISCAISVNIGLGTHSGSDINIYWASLSTRDSLQSSGDMQVRKRELLPLKDSSSNLWEWYLHVTNCSMW